MKVYLVGGAVRDELMGLTPSDLDYLVVGSTPEEMLSLGYKQVGADFPVFLHPETGDEYALARTEVKDGNGYQGFKCAFGTDVTLEEDLARRDLTINAMAKDLDTGEIIDPFNGRADLASMLLRPTTSAFQEDPVRVLRAARFLAKYPLFNKSVELIIMETSMHCKGMLSHLVPERVWAETVKALKCTKPSRYFEALSDYNIFPEINNMKGVCENNKWHSERDVFTHIMMGIDYAASNFMSEVVIFGVLCHDLGKPAAYEKSGGLKSTRHESLGVPISEALCDRLRAPAEYKYMATKAAELHTHIHLSFDMRPKTIHSLFKKLSNKVWLERLVQVAICDKVGRGKPACDWVYTQPQYILKCWDAMENTNTKDITSSMEPGPSVGLAIRIAEIAEISSVDKSDFQEPYDECMRGIL